MNALQFVADSFHTKKLCADFLQAKCEFRWKTAVLRFWAPLFGGLGATCDVHFRLVGKRIVNFLLVLTEIFARCYCWGSTSEYGLKIGDFAPTGLVDPKFQKKRGRLHQPFFFKTRLSYLSYGIKIWTYLSSVLSQCTRLTDGQTDRRTDSFRIARPRCMDACSAVINESW